MRLPHHLVRQRCGIFHFRLVVPADLRATVKGRVIKRSLRTCDPRAALGAALSLSAGYARLFAHLRPQPEEIATLRDLCGSPLALPQFRQRLRRAMVLLSKGDTPLVVSWSIDGKDRLIVSKNATRVVILKPEISETKQRGIRPQDRKADAIQKARAQRSTVAL